MFDAKMTKNGCLYYLYVREFVCLLMCIQMCVSEMDIDHIFKQATGTLLSRVILSAEKLSLNSFLLKLKKGLLFAFCRSISVSEINFVFSRWRESKCGYEFVWREHRIEGVLLPTHTGFGNKQPMGALET